ncbi:MAG: hypothetical protein QOH06_2142 [Acidobacteriota bacterium]|jgi:hypothetical protein|nr:hypothetical protein [Acidobacteriota bacterium]
MTREEYEKRRRALEEQFRADIALMNAAHETRIRSLERLWQDTAENSSESARPAASAAPAQPAKPAPKRLRPRGSVLNDLDAALPGLPKEFDKHDIAQALGYEPAHTTLFRALRQLQAEGTLKIEDHSSGGVTTRYRKTRSTG